MLRLAQKKLPDNEYLQNALIIAKGQGYVKEELPIEWYRREHTSYFNTYVHHLLVSGNPNYEATYAKYCLKEGHFNQLEHNLNEVMSLLMNFSGWADWEEMMLELVDHKDPRAIEDMSYVGDLIYEKEKDVLGSAILVKVLGWKVRIAKVTGNKVKYWSDQYEHASSILNRFKDSAREQYAQVDADADAISDKVPGVKSRKSEDSWGNSKTKFISVEFDDGTFVHYQYDPSKEYPYITDAGIGYKTEHDAQAGAWAYKKYGVKRKKGSYNK